MIIHKCDVCGAEIKEGGCSKFVYKTFLDLEEFDEMPVTRYKTVEFCQDCAYKIKEKIERKEI